MSGGEKPDTTEASPPRADSIDFGEAVYNEDGAVIGTIRGMDESGVFVTTRDGMEALSIEHVRSGHDFGEAHLMWRCLECGEMGKINDGLPETCPGCGTEKENMMWWTED